MELMPAIGPYKGYCEDDGRKSFPEMSMTFVTKVVVNAREKCVRYLLYEILSNPGSKHGYTQRLRWSTDIIVRSVRNAVLVAHGEYGLALISASLSVKRSCFRQLQSAICMIKAINDDPVYFRSMHVGGSIKSCKKFLLKFQREGMTQLISECKTPAEREKIQQDIYQCCIGIGKKVETTDSNDNFADVC